MNLSCELIFQDYFRVTRSTFVCLSAHICKSLDHTDVAFMLEERVSILGVMIRKQCDVAHVGYIHNTKKALHAPDPFSVCVNAWGRRE